MSTGIIALIVLFQPEVRKFLLMLGSTNFAKKNKAFKRLQFLNGSPKKSTTDAVSIVKASNSMSTSKTGALIIIERNTNLDFLVDTRDKMNINLTQAIIETIFLYLNETESL